MNYPIDSVNDYNVIKSIKHNKKKNKIIVKYLKGRKEVFDYTEEKYLKLRTEYYRQAKLFSYNKDIKINSKIKNIIKYGLYVGLCSNIIDLGIMAVTGFGIVIGICMIMLALVCEAALIFVFDKFFDKYLELLLWLIGKIDIDKYKKYFTYEKEINKHNELEKEKVDKHNAESVMYIEPQLIDINEIAPIENLSLTSLMKLKKYVINIENVNTTDEKGKQKVMKRDDINGR